MIVSLIQKALRGEKTARPPFWFMRQAGRYLPEYRAIRKDVKDFLSLCYTPELAAEVTLQPIRRFDMDAAILFSDILVVPDAMGQDVRFVSGEGPKLPPLITMEDISRLSGDVVAGLSPIAQTIRRVKKELAVEKALIGFCGAPWTVACYMVQGGGSRDFAQARQMALGAPELFSLLIDKIVEASAAYLCMQVEAGVDVLQLFDSWAGVLPECDYDRWVITPTRELVRKVKARHPDIRIIGFAKGSGVLLERYARQSGVDAVGLDAQTPVDWAHKHIQLPLQGNLDPLLLAGDRDGAVSEARRIMKMAGDRRFIFNLGHGIVPHTPIDNVQAVCDAIREKR